MATINDSEWITDCADVLLEVLDERKRQHAKWGYQNLPNGTGDPIYGLQAEGAKVNCDEAAKIGMVTFRHILCEEFYEALAETNPERLRRELIQVAAVCVQWSEALSRRAKHLRGEHGEINEARLS